MDIGITYIDYYIPETTLDTFDFIKEMGVNFYREDLYSSYEEFIKTMVSKFECKKIPVELEKTAHEMCEYLVDKYFQDSKNAGDIDLIIFTGGSFVWELVQFSPPHKIMDKYKLNNAMLLQIFNFCCSTPSAIQVAKNLILHEQNINNALIISNCLVKDHKRRYLSGSALIGDGAGILKLERSKKNIIKDYVYFNDSRFNNLFIDNSINDISVASLLDYINLGLKSIETILNRNNLSANDIDQYLIQNTNRFLNHFYAKKLKIDTNKISAKNIPKYGHIGDVDFIINLKDYIDSIEISQNVICQYNSAGITSNSILINNIQK